MGNIYSPPSNLPLTLMRVTLKTVPNFKCGLLLTLFCETPNLNLMQIQSRALQIDMVSTHISGAYTHKDITNSTDDALQYKDVSFPITWSHINLRPIHKIKCKTYIILSTNLSFNRPSAVTLIHEKCTGFSFIITRYR